MAFGDSAFGFTDPNTMALLGALQGISQFAGASRLPQTMGQALGSAAGGMLGGIEAGQKYQAGQQQISGESLKNFMALDAIRRQAAGLGQPMPSLQDIQSGKYQVNWSDVINEMMQRWQAQQSAAPQIPQAGGQTPTPANAPQMPAGVPNLNARLARDATSGRVTDTLTKLGYSPLEQSAALGNAAWESSLNPTDTSGDQGTSMGLWQWHSPERKAGLLRYAQNTNRNWSDPSVQAEYMDQELRQRAPEFFDPNKSLAEKTKIFQDKFEVPAKDTSKERTQLAQNLAGGAVSDAAAVSGVPPASAGGTGMTMSPRDAFAMQALSSIFGKPSQALTDYYNAALLPPGTAPQQIGMAAALHQAGISPFIDVRPNGSVLGVDPSNPFGPPKLLYHAPTAPAGHTYEQSGPGGQLRTVEVPGGLQAIANSKAAERGGEKAGELPFAGPIAGAKTAAEKAAAYRAEYGNLIPGNALPEGGPPIPSGATPTPEAQQPVAPAKQPIGTRLGIAPDTNKPLYSNIPPASGQQLPQSPAEAQAMQKPWQDRKDEFADAVDPAQQAEERLLAQASIYKSIQTGAWKEQKASIAAKIKAMGINPSRFNLDDPAGIEAALHENYQGTLNYLKTVNSRFTQREFATLSEYNPHPNLQPAANLQLLAEGIANLRRDQALAHDWETAQKQGWRNPVSWEAQYMHANPIGPIINAVAHEIGPLEGMVPGATSGGAPYSPTGAGQSGEPTPRIATSPRPAPLTATGPNGHKIVLENGQWVDAVTHQPLPAR